MKMQENNHEIATIPYAAHEAQMARNAKQMRLMTVAICFMALLLFLMCITCMYGYEEEVTTTTTTTEEYSADSGDGGNAIVGDGDITIGDGKQEGYYGNDNDGQADEEVTDQQ